VNFPIKEGRGGGGEKREGHREVLVNLFIS
jgi:hypothetical protein